jgi:hypothetical protein
MVAIYESTFSMRSASVRRFGFAVIKGAVGLIPSAHQSRQGRHIGPVDAAERRLQIVVERQLQASSRSLVGEFGDEVQRVVDAGRYASRRDELPVLDPPLLHETRPN